MRCIADDVEDGWRRAMVLMSSATAEELVDPDLPPHGLLFRLFHEDGVRVYDTHTIEARCRCSRQRIEGILRCFRRMSSTICARRESPPSPASSATRVMSSIRPISTASGRPDARSDRPAGPMSASMRRRTQWRARIR